MRVHTCILNKLHELLSVTWINKVLFCIVHSFYQMDILHLYIFLSDITTKKTPKIMNK